MKKIFLALALTFLIPGMLHAQTGVVVRQAGAGTGLQAEFTIGPDNGFAGVAPFFTTRNILLAQTAAIAQGTILNVTTTAMYHVEANISCTVASAAATVTMTVNWTDSSGTAQSTSQTATCTTLGSASWASIIINPEVKTGFPIARTVTIVGTPTYNFRMTIAQTTQT